VAIITMTPFGNTILSLASHQKDDSTWSCDLLESDSSSNNDDGDDDPNAQVSKDSSSMTSSKEGSSGMHTSPAVASLKPILTPTRDGLSISQSTLCTSWASHFVELGIDNQSNLQYINKDEMNVETT
jgi:hypothetical protein